MEAARVPIMELERGVVISASPAAIQTSPGKISWISIRFDPLTISSHVFPVKEIGLRVNRHDPDPSATVRSSRPAQVTMTVSPGAAVPQTGSVTPCWITM